MNQTKIKNKKPTPCSINFPLPIYTTKNYPMFLKGKKKKKKKTTSCSLYIKLSQVPIKKNKTTSKKKKKKVSFT